MVGLYRDMVLCDVGFYTVGIFYPPAGISPTKLELNNNVEMFEDNVVDNVQLHQSLPRPVQELMDADGQSQSPSSTGVDNTDR